MLGAQIGEARGKRTGRRVIATEPQVKVEVSFEDQGTILGVEAMNIGTYVSTIGADGNLHGFGEGVAATVDGETVAWKGMGVGRLGAGGSVSYCGSLLYTTTSTKLAKLNGIAGVFQFEVDAQGNTHARSFELAPTDASQGSAA
jgi:hypothetical protein